MAPAIPAPRERSSAAFVALLSLLLGLCAALAINAVRRSLIRPVPSATDASFSTYLGMQLPAFSFQTLAGVRLSESSLVGIRWVLYFGHHGCGACRETYSALKATSCGTCVVMVTGGGATAVDSLAEALGVRHVVWADARTPLAEDLDVSGVPTVFALDPAGRITDGARGDVRVRALLTGTR